MRPQSCVLFVYSACGDFISTSTSKLVQDEDIDVASASQVVQGCTDVHFVEYDADAILDDGSCATLLGIESIDLTQQRSMTDNGKTGSRQIDTSRQNPVHMSHASRNVYVLFVHLAVGDITVSSASQVVRGCTDAHFAEYDVDATVEDGSCDTLINTDSTQPLQVDIMRTLLTDNNGNILHGYVVDSSSYNNSFPACRSRNY